LNGHPVNGGYDGQVNGVGLPIENVDQIEIVRGPYSALYGGTAMGGTIQIITRDIDKTTLSINKSHLFGSGEIDPIILDSHRYPVFLGRQGQQRNEKAHYK